MTFQKKCFGLSFASRRIRVPRRNSLVLFQVLWRAELQLLLPSSRLGYRYSWSDDTFGYSFHYRKLDPMSLLLLECTYILRFLTKFKILSLVLNDFLPFCHFLQFYFFKVVGYHPVLQSYLYCFVPL